MNGFQGACRGCPVPTGIWWASENKRPLGSRDSVAVFGFQRATRYPLKPAVFSSISSLDGGDSQFPIDPVSSELDLFAHFELRQ